MSTDKFDLVLARADRVMRQIDERDGAVKSAAQRERARLNAGLGRTAVHSQAAAALALVVHLRRTPEGRRVDEIGVVRRSGDLVVVEPGWRADGGPCPARTGLHDLVTG